jgi:predicted RND superfamily exporter protein
VKWFSSFILRYAGWVSLLGTLLALVGGYYSVLLYQNLRTDIHELLPTTARSVVDLHEVSSRLESIENLAVLIFSQHPKESKRFVIDLANRLEKAPKNVIASIDYRIDAELKFFKSRQALFLEVDDLIKIRNYVRDRIEYEKTLYNPLTIFSEDDIEEPKLDFSALRKKYEGKTSNYERLPEGFYATPDGTKRALLVNIPGASSNIAGQHRLKAEVEKAIADLDPHSYAKDIEIKFTGGVEDSIEEQAALVADLELSTVICTVIVSIGMLAFYRAIRATAALMLSLFMGTFWTFGVSYFAVGYLNANSAFLGSIVIGNGINFGIIYLARYLEERRKKHGNLRATKLAMIHTATSTWTAALAAGLSYGSLILTGFRGFKQFGIIGLIGMVLCWISAFTLLPAYLTVLDRFSSLVRKKNAKPPKARLAGSVAYLVGKFPKTLWTASMIATVLSIGAVLQFTPKILETDLSKLRNRESLESGSAYLSKYLDEIFQQYLSPLVILPDNRENARKIAELLKKKKTEEGSKSLIASVSTLDDFIPKNQDKKIAVLKEVRLLLPPKLLKRLSKQDQELIQSFLTQETLKPFSEKDLPPFVRRKFTEKDGSIGKLVLVEPPLTKDVWDGQRLVQFIKELRSVADSVEPGAPVAGSNAISSDMISAISQDGPKATFFAFLAVVVLVILLFRNVKTITLILFSLFIGVLWLGGLIFGFEIKINFLNFIALPITFGIGVDYGVNIFHRYREVGSGHILTVIRNTGSAVGLCSFSTIIGYTSLLIAGNQGFVSFGVLAVAGEVTCLIAAIVSLPALLTILDKRKRRKAI